MKKVTQLWLATGVSVVLAIGIMTIAQAYSTGRAQCYGYFYNNNSGCNNLDRVLTNGLGSIAGKEEFITLIDNYRAGGGANGIGADFIIQTMRGGTNHNLPSNADVADWKARVRNSTVTMTIEDQYYTSNTAYAISEGDEVAYDDSATASSAVFRVNGTIVYILKHLCGNPLNDLPGLQPSTTTSTTSTSGGTTGSGSGAGCAPMNVTVRPGTDYNGDPVAMGVTITGPPVGTSFIGSYKIAQDIDVASSRTTGDQYTVVFQETGSYISGYKTVTVTDDATGTVISSTTTPIMSPGRSGGSAIIGPCYDYSLAPKLTTDIRSGGAGGVIEVIEPDAPINTSYSVTNGPGDTGHSTKSMNTVWQVTKMIYQPGVAIPHLAGGFTPNQPACGGYFKAAAGSDCVTIKSGSRVFAGSLKTDIGSTGAVAEDLTIGSHVCFALSVQPYRPYTDTAHSVISTEWRHSEPVCLIIGKKPKVQIWGGDLSVGKVFSGPATSVANIQTGISMKTGSKMFGSWVEYGIFARGAIIGAGSGSAFSGPGRTGTLVDVCGYSRLSFTNYSNDASCSLVGKYDSAKSIPNVAASFPGSSSLPVGFSGRPSDLPSGTYASTGPLTLQTSTLAPGKSVILKVTGTVTINGDQKYQSDMGGGVKYTVAGQLPQLVIVADTIIINDGVKAIDAWLVSKGDLTTCSSVPPLTSITCQDQLTVNGPVMAKRLLLRRTAGSGPGPESGIPAEIFNLRADTYLWATSRAVGNGRIQTVDTTELPPRL